MNRIEKIHICDIKSSSFLTRLDSSTLYNLSAIADNNNSNIIMIQNAMIFFSNFIFMKGFKVYQRRMEEATREGKNVRAFQQIFFFPRTLFISSFIKHLTRFMLFSRFPDFCLLEKKKFFDCC